MPGGGIGLPAALDSEDGLARPGDRDVGDASSLERILGNISG